MPRRRFGVVLLLRGPVADEVDGLRRALGDPALGRIPPHVTLVPPVNVRESEVSAGLDVLRSAASSLRPFRVVLGPPATFQPDNPVLYLDVDGPVAGARERVFVPPFERTLTWPFVPHCTLLDGGPPERLAAAVAALADYRAPVLCDRVHLLEERRRDDGLRVWEPVADFPFSAPAVVGRGGLELEISQAEGLAPDAAAWHTAAWRRNGADVYGDAVGDARIALVARRGGEIVATATGFVRGDEGQLERLTTDLSVRGEGIGSHLLAAFESAAAQRGATFLSLRARVGSDAEGLYRRRGFETFTELPGWRHGHDFVQLRKAL